MLLLHAFEGVPGAGRPGLREAKSWIMKATVPRADGLPSLRGTVFVAAATVP